MVTDLVNWNKKVSEFPNLFKQFCVSQPAAVAACLALAVLLWLIHYLNTGFPLGLAFLYPFTVLANVGIALRSCAYSLGGNVEWKGRRIARKSWKWL